MSLSDKRNPILAFIGTIIFVGLFIKAQQIDYKQHENFNSNLRQIKELEAKINQNLLKSRYGLLTYYDPLAKEIEELTQLHEQLNKIPSYLSRNGQIEVKKRLQTQQERFKKKEQFIERFKSENAVLRNSLYYFPKLTTDLVEKASAPPEDRVLIIRLENLLRDILIYNLTASEDIAPKIEQGINSLLKMNNQNSSQINDSDLNQVILHSKIILTNKPKVDSLINEIISLSTLEDSEAVYKAYNNYYESALKTTNIYRLILFVFSIVLIGSVSAYIIAQLKKSSQAVTAAKEKLQDALEATQEAEEKYRGIFQNSTDGIFQTTSGGSYLNANPTLAKIYGYSSVEDLISNLTNISKQLYVEPKRREEFIADLELKNTITQFESRVFRKDGSMIWISENARAVRDDRGKLLYYEGTVQDITARKHAETALQASEIKLGMQQTALIALSKCQPLYNGDLKAAFQEITETAAYTLGVDRASIWLYTHNASIMHCANSYELHKNQHIEGMEIPATDYLNHLSAREKANCFITANNDCILPEIQQLSGSYVTRLGDQLILDVPIRLGDRTIGMLCLEYTENSLQWSVEEENFANYLAYMAYLAMEAKERKLAEAALREEQQKVEMLLLNILPAPIAQRLKEDSGSIAESFAEVTVLFADLVGFTELSSRVSPVKLVELLNQIFSAFDELAEKHGLEKIKTIGDAYMVVGGLPMPRSDHAEAIAEMAIDMQLEIEQQNIKNNTDFHIRVGISTGPVVAGVIGIKKFIYDLWGDTVNIASRMESHGLPGKIHMAAATYELLKDKFIIEPRGAIQVKGKGEMITYFLIDKK